jgi:hypothetical protein
MKRCYWLALTVCILALAGCTSRSRARDQARAAFAAGQQQGLQQAQQLQHPGLNVTVAGPVKYTVVPWTVELTVARAIIAAEYLGTGDPHQIIIFRNGQQITVDPERLLNGEDQPLQAGDVLQLKP